jgi:predicted dehydrogenase
MVKSSGGRCIALDLDSKRLDLARQFGAELTVQVSDEADPVSKVLHFTNGYGADTVIFTAATANPAALSQAFGMIRKKGRLVMVGVYGKELRRDDIYQKEIDFLISTSYGPGRYDDNYERKGCDYPYPYIRWTENRNMEEYLRLMASGSIDIKPMINAVYPIERVTEAFEALKQQNRPLIVLLHYGDPPDELAFTTYKPGKIEFPAIKVINNTRIRVGFIGAGNFAKAMHLPNLKKLNDKYQLVGVCNRQGLSAKQTAFQYGAKYATTDYQEILNDKEIDLVMICTRHDLHGKMVLDSLKAGKHTFVEKPLCITRSELESVRTFFNTQNEKIPLLMVGFNRRFSKHVLEAKKHTDKRINPLFIHYRMNVGYIHPIHWIHGDEGGGRIVGEACHIIDLFTYFIQAKARTITTASLTPKTGSLKSEDNKVISIEYSDGSVAVLEYFSIGSKEYPKEFMEIHFDEKTIVIDDYKSTVGYGLKINEIKTSMSDKGQFDEINELYSFLKNGAYLIPLEDIFQTTEIAFAIQEG